MQLVYPFDVNHGLMRLSCCCSVYIFVVEGSLSSSRKRAREAERQSRVSGVTQEIPIMRQRTPNSGSGKLMNLVFVLHP